CAREDLRRFAYW
nr:immunoglobulin heavy chain junction region [Mus musculus]NSM04145.1 immunoglobulin heavy chain junction region [Mus musculus]NSM05923.1 immunoglobulin heavy chain junction region [Mus musculus]NSM07269.1 immunoglobulin heavy chain junction region [Mus musculus]NSM07294.1 immunoglobulin heavy chain junction region [Mus musculus]